MGADTPPALTRRSHRIRFIATLRPVFPALPFVFPGIAVGVAILSGFSSGVLILSGTRAILALAYVIRRTPYIFCSASAALTQIDPTMEEASATCGAL